MKLFGFKFGTVVAWYDFWIGAFFNQEKRRLYLMVPFFGITIERANVIIPWQQQVVLDVCGRCGNPVHDGECNQ